MACDVRILPSALMELESAVAYLAEMDPSAASSFLEAWEGVLEDLRSGVVEHRLSRFEVLARLGYRTVLFGRYVVLYVKEEDDVVIAHLFHQSQDYANIVLRGSARPVDSSREDGA